MSNISPTVEEFAQSISTNVSDRLGLKDVVKSLSFLFDIKKLLTAVIDPNKTLSADQKLPTAFIKGVSKITETLEETKENSLKETKENSPKIIESLPKVISKEVINTFNSLKETKENSPKIIESLPKVISKEVINTFNSLKETKENSLKETKENKPVNESKLESKQAAPTPFLFAGFTPDGLNALKERLPEIIQKSFKSLITAKTDATQTKDGAGGGLGLLSLPLKLLGGGAALLLGGLAALITGLMTDGPFKGLLKILSTAGLAGGLKLLETGAKMFVKNLKSVITAPAKLFGTIYKGLKGIFGKTISKEITQTLAKTAGLLPKMMSGLAKFITPLLKKLPLIGTVISLGFAFTRFKSGDVVGGIIDVLSGVASLVPGVGTAIAIGLDVLNAFLDVKTGGATAETSKKKSGILGNFLKDIGIWILDKAEYVPIIGRLIKAGKAFASKDWADGLTQLSRVIPGTGWIMDLFGYTEEVQKQVVGEELNVIERLIAWIKDSIWNKVTGFIGNIVDGAKEAVGNYIDNLSLNPLSWVGLSSKEETPKEQPKSSDLATNNPTSTSEQPVTEQPAPITSSESTPDFKPMAKGGIVTKPIKALVGEAGPEAVFPLEKLEKFLSKNNSRSDSILQKIADNTGLTNGNLGGLIKGFNNLSKALKEAGAIKQAPIVVNNTQEQNQRKASVSQLANIGNPDHMQFRAGISDDMFVPV